jgi:predicted PurR-regulated permease PerM
MSVGDVTPPSHDVQETGNRVPSRGRYPGPLLRTAGDYAWRLLLLGAVAYFAVQVLSRLSLVVIPFIASLLVTAFLRPLMDRQVRFGLPRLAATLVTVLAAIGVLGGILTVVVVRAADQAPRLGDEINSLIPHVKNWLIHGPLKLNPTTVDNLDSRITSDVTKNSSKIASTALSTGKAALSVIGGFLLTIFSTIFLLYDGDRVWSYLLKAVPQDARPVVDQSGRAAWTTLTYYVRGILVVAFFHGLVVYIALTVMGVPLAFPLAVLVALGSFIPLVGAILTGALAAGVAGLTKGLVAAVVVVGLLLIDNQIEAHALQPFVVGRYVRIHPLAVVLALATGAILFGIVGAVVAVPIVACLNSAVRTALDLTRSPAEGDRSPVEENRPEGGDDVPP